MVNANAILPDVLRSRGRRNSLHDIHRAADVIQRGGGAGAKTEEGCPDGVSLLEAACSDLISAGHVTLGDLKVIAEVLVERAEGAENGR